MASYGGVMSAIIGTAANMDGCLPQSLSCLKGAQLPMRYCRRQKSTCLQSFPAVAEQTRLWHFQ